MRWNHEENIRKEVGINEVVNYIRVECKKSYISRLGPKLPRLFEFPILPKQPLKFILYSHVVCLVEFTRQCTRSYPEKFASTVANAGESSAKHVFLCLMIHVVVSPII